MTTPAVRPIRRSNPFQSIYNGVLATEAIVRAAEKIMPQVKMAMWEAGRTADNLVGQYIPRYQRQGPVQPYQQPGGFLDPISALLMIQRERQAAQSPLDTGSFGGSMGNPGAGPYDLGYLPMNPTAGASMSQGIQRGTGVMPANVAAQLRAIQAAILARRLTQNLGTGQLQR